MGSEDIAYGSGKFGDLGIDLDGVDQFVQTPDGKRGDV